MSDEAEPKYYPVRLVWTGGKSGDLTVEGKVVIKTGVPSGGPDEAMFHSPEDLFVAAATSCFMTTFIAFTKKIRFEHKAFSCEGKGTLERVEKGFQFTKLLLNTTVVVESEELKAKAERALELAAKYCLVANSMKCSVAHEDHVIVG